MSVLIVVDMQNDFVHPDGACYGGRLCSDIIPAVDELIEEFHADEKLVIYTMDTHEPDDTQFGTYDIHCLDHSWGQQIVEPLDTRGAAIVKKHRFSAFYKTALDHIYEFKGVTTLVCGVFASMCVLHTLGDLYYREAKIVIPRNCIADFDMDTTEYFLKYFERVYQAKII